MNVLRNSVARAIADVKRGMLLATIDIAAPPERVFRAVTSEELTRWWGFRVTRYGGDIRVGGAWRTEGVGANGKPFVVRGEFLEVERPHKLMQTCRHWEPRGMVTTLTWHLENITGGTRVIVHHEGFGDAQESCADHADGWEHILNQLSGHVGAKA
jgi:uncharacterized protein YndB with AHSA1/START domain